MALIKDGKVYRNLEEQVLKNKEDYEYIRNYISEHSGKAVQNIEIEILDIISNEYYDGVATFHLADGTTETHDITVPFGLEADNEIVIDANEDNNKLVIKLDETFTSRISSIEEVVPSQASSTNQLADKEFVNSTIATNTSTFRGTFNSLAELQAYSGTKTNNDYAFVISTDTYGNRVYKRYKYNGSSWVYEYDLNNSSFTENQWKAINSGIDSTAKAKYDGFETGKQNTINASNKLPASNISGLANVATSGSYSDLSNKPTIPAAANNGKLTIKYSVDSGTEQTKEFTANQSGDITIDLGNIISSHQDISGKLDKTTSIGSIDRVYGILSNGNQQIYSMSDANAAYYIVRRDGNGQFKVGTPTDDAHVTTKKYVDDAIAAGGSETSWKKLDSDTALSNEIQISELPLNKWMRVDGYFYIQAYTYSRDTNTPPTIQTEYSNRYWRGGWIKITSYSEDYSITVKTMIASSSSTGTASTLISPSQYSVTCPAYTQSSYRNRTLKAYLIGKLTVLE